jgi:hypothetical protein
MMEEVMEAKEVGELMVAEAVLVEAVMVPASQAAVVVEVTAQVLLAKVGGSLAGVAAAKQVEAVRKKGEATVGYKVRAVVKLVVDLLEAGAMGQEGVEKAVVMVPAVLVALVAMGKEK